MSERRAELAAALIRNFNTAPLELEVREPLYATACARLARGTAAQKLGASIDVLQPGKRGCPYHLHHAQEEMFIILEGSGTLRVAGELLPLVTGDIVFIPPGPDYPHQIINTSERPLKMLSISTMETPEICEYPDSSKFLAQSHAGSSGNTRSPADARSFAHIGRAGESLDYWHGEP